MYFCAPITSTTAAEAVPHLQLQVSVDLVKASIAFHAVLGDQARQGQKEERQKSTPIKIIHVVRAFA